MGPRRLIAGIALSVGLASSAHAQLTPIPAFTGAFGEGFDVDNSGGDYEPCIVGRVFNNRGDLCTVDQSGNPITGCQISAAWSWHCDVDPFEGPSFFAAFGGIANYTFDQPVVRFGGYFVTPNNNIAASGYDVTFYDSSAAVIGTQHVAFSGCNVWTWAGWESTTPIRRVKVASVYAPYSGTYAAMDSMVADPFPGACCHSDGTCTSETSDGCAAIFGAAFQGFGTTCGSINCANPPAGACCHTDGSCTSVTSASCAGGGGTYQGAGTGCATANCPQPTGACCQTDGSCTSVTSAACTAIVGAVYQGNFTSCGTVNCPQPTGACCFQSHICSVLTSADCVVQGGLYRGNASNCAASCLGTLEPIGTFAGTYQEGFEVDNSGGDYEPCIVGRVFNNRADLCTVDQSGNPITGCLINQEWSWHCTADAFEGWNFFGAFGGIARYTFDQPVARFGGYFVTPNNNIAASGYDVTFYDPSGAVIGTQHIAFAGCNVWTWAGWESTTPIKRVKVASVYPQYGGTYAAMDAMVVDPFPGSVCYPNCDHTTTAPILNVADFTCFLQKFAAQDSYANCDGSTRPPVLNVADFSCFLQKYAAGCP